MSLSGARPIRCTPSFSRYRAPASGPERNTSHVLVRCGAVKSSTNSSRSFHRGTEYATAVRPKGVRHGRGSSLRFFFLCRCAECSYTLSKGGPQMPDSLPALEDQRFQILRQFAGLGDLRPGSICAVARRCGKPTCHCAKPNDAVHDPQLRLTRKVDGKTVAESFPSPAAFLKAQAEVHEYQRLQNLCAELVEVNEKICRLRPFQPEKWSAEEKKRLLRSIKKSRGR